MTTPVLVSENDLNELRQLIEHRSGIRFDSDRERFFSGRIREHAQERKLSGSGDLMRRIQSSNVEYEALLARLLTHETSFFRYPAAFEALTKFALPEVHARKMWANPRTLRIWSAGCSTGEEPYSIAIAVAENLSFARSWTIEILATDISRSALATAGRAIYPRRSLGSLTPAQIDTHFTPVDGCFEVKPHIRRMVNFASMNLAHSLYMGRMDIILCMNVLIYFSEEHRAEAIRRIYNCLEPGGFLMLGHSETLLRHPSKFEKTVVGDHLLYRKPLGDAASDKRNPS
jgi:chemotaxis protein methyltransferase CheR